MPERTSENITPQAYADRIAPERVPAYKVQIMEQENADMVLQRLKHAVGATTDFELAKKLGLSKQSIAAARARGEVPAAWIPKVAKQFAVSADWLFFGGPARSESAAQGAAHGESGAESCVPCPACAQLEDELKQEREERRELTRELREVNAQNRALWQENSRLREAVAKLELR